jgi:uncharacterized cupredoxin-like copper-binding protein
MTQRMLVSRIAPAAAVLVLLAACGDNKKDTAVTPPQPVVTSPAATPMPQTSDTPSAGSSSDASATTVPVDLTEFKIGLTKSTFTAGTYTFTATNSGKFPHAFQVDGPGVADKGTGTVQPGDSGSVTVTLQKGTYTFYCPVPGHKEKGMTMQVTVT